MRKQRERKRERERYTHIKRAKGREERSKIEKITQ
jgi:hypothetical protein